MPETAFTGTPGPAGTFSGSSVTCPLNPPKSAYIGMRKPPPQRTHPFVSFAHATASERWKGMYVSQACAAKRHVPGGSDTLTEPQSKAPSVFQEPDSVSAH